MNSDPSWDSLQAFGAVLETGSLSGAARKLGLAQPTVRGRIDMLEGALGTVLFTRTAHGLVPTDQARALSIHAEAMSLASGALVRAASGTAGEVSGVVRIGVSEFIGSIVLPPMLGRLRERYPRLAVEVMASNETADIAAQEADIAVRNYPPRQETLIARKVGAVPVVLYAHRDYLAKRGRPERLEDLRDHDVIGPDRSVPDIALARTLQLDPQDFSLRTDSHTAQYAAILAAVGVGALQEPVGAMNPDLVRLLPGYRVAELEIWIVVDADLQRLPKVRAVFDWLLEEFAGFVSGKAL